MVGRIIRTIIFMGLILFYSWLGQNRLFYIFGLLFGRNKEMEPMNYEVFYEYLLPDLLSLFGSLLIIGYSIKKLIELIKTIQL